MPLGPAQRPRDSGDHTDSVYRTPLSGKSGSQLGHLTDHLALALFVYGLLWRFGLGEGTPHRDRDVTYTRSMSTTPLLDADQTRVAAQEILRVRTAVIETLVETVNARRLAAAALSEAERAEAVAYAEATKAGWTDAELKQLGVDAPARKLPGRPRRQRATASTPTGV